MDEGDRDSPRAARMFEAVQGLERRLGRRVTLDELGTWVAEQEGRADPYAGSVVRRWLKDLSEPRSTAGWQALAATLGVDAGWLAFGTATAPTAQPAPHPEDEEPIDGQIEPDLFVDAEQPGPAARRRANGG